MELGWDKPGPWGNMQYRDIRRGIFVQRHNRFVATVELDGAPTTCHVRNTGRCRELLLPGATVVLERVPSLHRKTAYSLIAVWKGDRLVNIDATAPNRIFAEWVPQSDLFPGVTLIRPEAVYGDSRFDFYIESEGKPAFVEVKGVTLEEDGVARFPDAPTLRGVKHLRGLAACLKEGYAAWIVFIVQMKGVSRVEPNWATHPAFGHALREAAGAGVGVLALDCGVREDSITADAAVPVLL